MSYFRAKTDQELAASIDRWKRLALDVGYGVATKRERDWFPDSTAALHSLLFVAFPTLDLGPLLDLVRLRNGTVSEDDIDPAMVVVNTALHAILTRMTKTLPDEAPKGKAGDAVKPAPKGRKGRKPAVMTPMEQEVWDLYRRREGSGWGIYAAIADDLKKKYPSLTPRGVEKIVRRLKERAKRRPDAG